jgi:predicted AlkP superfamily phosphohydrolase/phosphomutase
MKARPFLRCLALALATACQRHEATEAPAAAAVVPVESDDGARPAVEAPSPRPVRPVIWIALDGMDPDHLRSLAAGGALPNWQRLSGEGYFATLEAYEPMLSPLLWTTQATGVGPDIHRVLDFQEAEGGGGQLVPVSIASRKVPAIWSIASQSSRRVGVVGFWASHPAEVVHGFLLSDRIADPSGALPPGAASPPSLAEAVARVRERERRPSPADLAAFVTLPVGSDLALSMGNDASSDPVAALADVIGATRVTQRLARELYDRERPDFTAVYFEGTDAIGHLFARFAPPKLACTDEASYERFHRAPETYFRLVDALLGQWMRRAKEDGAVLVVTSDHGFRWGPDRLCGPSSVQGASAALAHRKGGVFLAWGDGVSPMRPRRPVSTFDVAPTLCALLGVPIDRSMSGAVVPVVHGLTSARSDIASRVVVHTVPAAPVGARAADEYAKKLAALGYISARDAAASTAAAPASAGLTKGAWNNLGIYRLLSGHDPVGARRAFDEALRLDPGYASPMLNIARIEKDAGRTGEASRWLARSAAAGLPDAASVVERWAEEFDRRDPAVALSLATQARAAVPQAEVYARLEADLLARHGRCSEASQVLAPLEQSREPATLNAAAAVQGCLGRTDRAAALLARSLAIDPSQERIRQTLASLPR